MLVSTSSFLQRSDAFVLPTRCTTTTTKRKTDNHHPWIHSKPDRFFTCTSVLHVSLSNVPNTMQTSSNPTSGEKSLTTTRKFRTRDDNFHLLVQYEEIYGHCNVPRRYKQDPVLGRWVNTQRQRKDKLSDDQCAKLDDLGFSWSMKRT
jgi:hypothetical protein